MPLFSVDQMVANSNLELNAEVKKSFPGRENVSLDRENTTMEQFKAAFRTENVVGSYMAQTKEIRGLTSSGRQLNPGFNPFGYLATIGRLQDSATVAYTNNEAEIDTILDFIDKQNTDREIVRGADWYTVLAAASIDPTILLPGTMAIKAGKLAKRVYTGIASTAALTSGAVGIQEALLHDSQSQRTIQESALAVVSAAVLGGVIGSVVGAASGGAVRRLARDANIDEAASKMSAGANNAHAGMVHEKQFNGPRTSYDDTQPGKVLSETEAKLDEAGEPVTPQSENEVSSVTRLKIDSSSSMRVVSESSNEEGLAYLNTKVFKRLTQPFGFLRNPITSGLSSASEIAQKFTNTLFNHGYELGKNLRGQATQESVEVAMNLDEIKYSTVLAAVDKIYLHYIGVPGEILTSARALKAVQFDGKMTRAQFSNEVATAMRNGDKHPIKAVQDAAIAYRKPFDELFIKAQELGLISKETNLKTAVSYLTRKYNITKILANPKAFRDAYRADLYRQGFTKAQADKEVWSVYKKITSQDADDIAVNSGLRRLVEGAGNYAKERVSNATDNGIAEYLESDVEAIAAQYFRTMSAGNRFKEGLLSMGFENLIELQNAIRKQFAQLIEDAPTGPERIALQKEMLQTIKDSGNNAAIMLGQFRKKGENDKALRTFRKLQAVAMLGGVIISSLAEPAMLIFRNGFGPAARRTLAAMANGFSTSKIEGNSLNRFVLGLDLDSNNLVKALLNPDYDLSTGKSKIDKGFDAITSGIGTASGIKWWTNTVKRWAAVQASGSIMESIAKVKAGKTLSLKETSYLASLGIGKADYASFIKMQDAHSTKTGGSWISHFADWSDEGARRKFTVAISKEVDNTVITRGKGSIPYAVHGSELVAIMFQFKTFMAQASHKILAVGVQGMLGHRQAEVAMGMVGLIGMGMMVEAAKLKLAGKDLGDIDPDGADFNDWIVAGISRSGMLGLLDIPLVGLNPWFNNSRYAGQNAVGTIFGPATGSITNAATAINGFASDGADSTDGQAAIDASIRMLPYNNLFYLRLLLEESN